MHWLWTIHAAILPNAVGDGVIDQVKEADHAVYEEIFDNKSHGDEDDETGSK